MYRRSLYFPTSNLRLEPRTDQHSILASRYAANCVCLSLPVEGRQMCFPYFPTQLVRREHLYIWSPTQDESDQAPPAGHAHLNGCCLALRRRRPCSLNQSLRFVEIALGKDSGSCSVCLQPYNDWRAVNSIEAVLRQILTEVKIHRPREPLLCLTDLPDV